MTATNGAPGPAVDARGRIVDDPTLNVIANLETAVKRLDDLREADNKFQDSSIDHVKELATLRAEYEDKLRLAESRRIDAIRAVDVAAVASSARDAAVVAATLATQVTTSADTLRNQVELTKTAAAGALTTALEPIQKDIADLRRVQYEQAGQKAGTSETVDSRRAGVGLTTNIITAGILGISAVVTVLIAVHG
jgi:hypothetical protein